MALLRFSRRAYLEEFRSGSLYLNTQNYFKELENRDAQADRFENVDVIAQPRDIKSFRITNNQPGQVMEIPPQQFRGPLLINLGRRAYNLFCMYSIPTSTVGNPMVDPRNFNCADWDAFTVVRNSQEFLDRFQRAAEAAGFRMACNLVEYYDADAYTGDVGPFRKPNSFAYQREFRVVIFPGSAGPVRLELESLEDITAPIWPLAEINSLMEFNSPLG